MNSQRSKLVEKLINHFETNFYDYVPVIELPHNQFIYKHVLIKPINLGWIIIDTKTKTTLDQTSTKSCALILARCYADNRFYRFGDAKYFDKRYSRAVNDSVVFQAQLDKNFAVAEDRLLQSQRTAKYYFQKINSLLQQEFNQKNLKTAK